MAEVLIQIASYINYAFEETLGRIDMKYWPAIRDTTSAYYLAILSTCVAVVVINVLEQRRLKNRLSQQKSTEKQNNSRKGQIFDIAPDDEVKFESLVSQEEIDREVAKNTPGAYIPLKPNKPDQKGDEKLVSRVKKARQRAYNKVIEDEMTEEDRIEEFNAQEQQLKKIYALLAENEDTMGKMSFDDLKGQLNRYKL